MDNNNNERDFSPSDFVSQEDLREKGEEKDKQDTADNGNSDNGGYSQPDDTPNPDAGASMRTEFVRDGGSSSESGFDGFNPSAYQNFGDIGRWDSFSLDDEKKAKSRFSRYFLAAFIYLLAANIIMIACQLFITLTQSEEVSGVLLGSPTVILVLNAIAMYAISFPIFYLIVRKMRYVPRRKDKLSFKEFIVYLLMSEAAMYVGSLIGNTLMSYFDAIFGAENQNETIDLVTNAPIWLIILVACVLGPIVEELIFRKLLMDRLGMYGDRMMILISSIAFAIFHGNLHQLFYAFALGLLLGYVYSRTGRVIYTIVIHMIINFLGSVIPILALPYIEKLDELLPAMEAAMESGEMDAVYKLMSDNIASITIAGLYSIVITGLVVAGIVLLIVKRKQFFVSDRCEVFIPKQRRAAVIFLNVGVMLFLILNSATIIFDLVQPIVESLAEGGI